MVWLSMKSIMDSKAKWLTRQIHAQITSGNYNESDVFALIILLRELANEHKIQPIIQIADFVVHRNKDRGLYKDYRDFCQQILNGEQVTFKQEKLSLISVQDIQSSLNKAFTILDLLPIGLELANQITVCIISLFQSVRFVPNFIPSPTKTNDSTNSMVIGISSDKVALFCKGVVPPRGHIIAFPILVADNNFEPLPGVDGFMLLDRITVVYCVNGILHLDQRADKA